MAYMNFEGKGPYPCHRGEYCGNYCLSHRSHFYSNMHESPLEAARHHYEWLSKMRFGVPHTCQAGSAEKMLADGFVGLYLKEDSVRLSREEPCWTPPELMEPGYELFYNIGVPGLCHVIDPKPVVHCVDVQPSFHLSENFNPDSYKNISAQISKFLLELNSKMPNLAMKLTDRLHKNYNLNKSIHFKLK